MSELNREQITQALECCIKAECWGDCEELGCPAHTKQGCYFYLRTDDDYENTIYVELCKDALSLIKELTEENEYLKQQNEIYAVLNEKMEGICNSYAFQYGTVVPKEVFLKKERERTIREMQKEWNELKFLVEGEYYVFAEDLDLIAKEMLEE